VSLVSFAQAQLPPPPQSPVIGARMPALSPDGTTLAFVWRGDIWVAPATGGAARALTSHVEFDAYPVFSPDGKWLAFGSMRNGNWDIFVVPTAGGAPRQLTFSGGAEIPSDWSADGKTIVFTGQRDLPLPGIFGLEVATGRFSRLTQDYKSLARPSLSPDGTQLAFERIGFPWTRPRYHGSGAAQLWTLALADGKRMALADDGRQHLFPRFSADGKGIVCVTVGEETDNAQWIGRPKLTVNDSPKKTPNLWWYPARGGAPKRLTNFTGGSVRFPTIARRSGDIAFEYERDLYRLSPGATEPTRIALYCPADEKTSAVQRQTITNADVAEAALSPDGKTFAFQTRNDLWTIPTEKAKSRNADDAVRLTDYPGFDRSPLWRPDGKALYFVSDRDGNDRLYALDPATRAVTPIWKGNSDATDPQLSPDGSTIGFWVKGAPDVAGLYVWRTDGSAPPRRLLAVPSPQQGTGIAWSPDLRFIAYGRVGLESGASRTNLFVAPADGSGTPVNVTRLNAYHGQPVFSPDGKYLFFASNRDGDGLYALPLKPENARVDELELKFEKPTGPVRTEIDFEDTAQRIRKVVGQAIDGDLTATSDGLLVFVSGGDIVTTTYDGKEVKRVTTTGGISSLQVSPDAKTVSFVRGGQLFTLKYSVGGYPQTNVTFTANWERDTLAERKVAFNQFWRSYHTRFYDPNFHGRDWNAIRARYEPLMEAVGTRDEFATLLNMMVGELEASHAEVNPAPGPAAPQTRNLGIAFDYAYIGPGIRVADVPRRAPGSYEKTRIQPGDYLLQVDGRDVALTEDLFKVLNDKGERDFTLLVNSRPTKDGARTVVYKALSGAEWSDIHYRNRIEARRKLVETRSGGALGYVHIAGMGGPNQTAFERELYEFADGKSGMIIDVRENGGGNIGDRLISWLGLKPYSQFVPRDGEPISGPPTFAGRTWDKPIVVLMAESSFSNAEMFPYGMRATGLAKLVGMATPGYVIWTSGLPLVDGTSARMPGSGTYRKDGSPLENKGEEPDYKVPLSVEDYFAGRDPQLEKAIEVLKKAGN
jgi:tricorn protease